MNVKHELLKDMRSIETRTEYYVKDKAKDLYNMLFDYKKQGDDEELLIKRKDLVSVYDFLFNYANDYLLRIEWSQLPRI